MIGGDTCHLCGAHKTMVTGVSKYTKKWQTVAKEYYGITTYACGTTITRKRCKEVDGYQKVRIGKKCIEVGK